MTLISPWAPSGGRCRFALDWFGDTTFPAPFRRSLINAVSGGGYGIRCMPLFFLTGWAVRVRLFPQVTPLCFDSFFFVVATFLRLLSFVFFSGTPFLNFPRC